MKYFAVAWCFLLLEYIELIRQQHSVTQYYSISSIGFLHVGE